MTNNLKRIAIFVPGGLGDVRSGIHIPTLYSLVERLSYRFEIVAYSHRLPDEQPTLKRCGNATVKYLNATHQTDPATRATVFLKAFLQDNREHPFALLHGMWGIPFGLYAVLLNKLLGIPTVVSLLGRETASIPEINYGDLRKQPQKWLTLWLCENATTLTVQSKYQLEQLRAHGLKRNNVKVIPHGVDTSRFASRKNGNSAPPYHFISVGDKNRLKDPFTLLKAFALITQQVDARLRLIGEDHLHGELQMFVDELGISQRVEFFDYIPHDEIPNHLSWADILLHTSLSEGGGASVLEATTHGVLVCGTRVGFLSDFEDTIAVAVDVGDYQSLADKTLSLIHEESRQRLFRQRGREWSSAHDVDWTTQKYSELYET